MFLDLICSKGRIRNTLERLNFSPGNLKTNPFLDLLEAVEVTSSVPSRSGSVSGTKYIQSYRDLFFEKLNWLCGLLGRKFDE